MLPLYLHSSIFPKLSPQDGFALSVLAAITFSLQREKYDFDFRRISQTFWTKIRSSHDLSLAWERVVWAAATATAHIGIFHLVWKMGQVMYFIAVIDAILKSSFCQCQLYSMRVTDISWKTFGCQSAVILLLFQSLKGSKLTPKNKQDCLQCQLHKTLLKGVIHPK